MKRNESCHNELSGKLVLVPEIFLRRISNRQKLILRLLKSLCPSFTLPGDYIPEEEAKKLLNRKTTWFWQLRSSGKLSFTKVGNRIYYSKDDIQKLLNQHRQEAVKK